MRATPVNSGALRSVAYVPLAPEFKAQSPGFDGFLLVTFNTGGTFAWAVPSWCVGLLMASRSKGAGFHALVKRPGYRAVKMEG